ncbi:DCN1-like protein 3 [Onthophagus taurus]|uniref:DCN1-like protein 3 n=1 Tax=Onthophagus taurus TaxID=166361 RepID=UPI000C2011DF|nr:DCN1-like protein 3 [Onthophagus taurus]
MGSCLTCFKEPVTSALDNSTHCHREEMPEARLHPAPSHIAPQSPDDNIIISNGNHLPIIIQDTGGRFTAKRPHIIKLAPTMGIGDSKPSDVKLNNLFDNYREKDEDMIRVDGIIQLCKDLQVLPEDFKILVLAWKLNAEQMCRFTRGEFVNGLKSMCCDSIKAVQNKLPDLVSEIEDSPELFKDLYRFTFNFGLDIQSGQRSLLTEMAIDLWNLVFTIRKPPILTRWIKFLQRHPSIKGIPRDTWNMFLNFSETVGDDLSSYDDNEAWPSLFDDFVEYENDQMNQNISTEKDIEARD